MPEGVYELGVDIGSSSVVAALCRSDRGADSGAPGTIRASLSSALAAWSAGRELGEPGEADLIPPLPGLLARVGDATPVDVGGRTATAADAVAGLVRLLVGHATAQEGRAPRRTAVLVPPSWSGHRRAVLAAALRAAGVADAFLVSAAVAAVRAHVDSGELAATATAVVVDVGVATSDVAVVGPREDGELGHLVAPPAPLRWGGRDVDDAVLRHVRRCLELPADLSGPADRRRAVALRTACRLAKETASLETEVAITVDPAWSAGAVRLTREELEGAIADDVERIVAAAVDALADAGAAADELAAVVLTGGGSRMPLIAECLSDALAAPVCATADPSLTSAVGAARLAGDLSATTEEVAGDTGAATEPTPGLRRRNRGNRDGRSPGPRPRTSGRVGRTAPRGRSSRAGRVAVVAALFLVLVVGPSLALALVGSGAGVATDGTAAAGDRTAPDPSTTQAGTTDLQGTSGDGAAATSNADHQVAAPPTSRHTSTASQADPAPTLRSAAGSSTAAASSSAAAAAAAASTTAATTAGPTSTAPIVDTTTADPPPSTDPPPTAVPDPPPTTSDTPPPPASSSAPAPVPDPPASTTSTDPSTSSAPVSQPATDSTAATA